jgi:hypothetical protein
MIGKICVNTWSLERFALSGEMTFFEIAEKIAEMDVDGIDVNEIYMELNPNPNPARLRAIKRGCASLGLEITSCWFWGNMLGAVAMESFDAVTAHIGRYLAIAEYLNARFLTISNGNLPRGLTVEEGRSVLARLYERLARLAEDHQVIIGFEAPRAGSPFNSPSGTLELVKSFDSPYLTITPDFESWRRPTEKMPMRYAEDPDSVQAEPLPVQVFTDCLPYTSLIHAKFLEFDETGSDPNYPLREIFAAIRESGRVHDLCIEYEGWIPDIHPERDPIRETLKAVDLVRRERGLVTA